jgi:hypothetical protein
MSAARTAPIVHALCAISGPFSSRAALMHVAIDDGHHRDAEARRPVGCREYVGLARSAHEMKSGSIVRCNRFLLSGRAVGNADRAPPRRQTSLPAEQDCLSQSGPL